MAKEIKVIGFNILEIKAKKNPKFEGEISVNSNIHISSLEKQKLDLIKEEALNVNFAFILDYKDLGLVEIKGNILLIMDSKTLKEALSEWSSKQKLSQELNTLILNIIMQRASLKALQLEEELNLPPHIRIPLLKIQEKQ